MKKRMNNKGFSLVELIVVITILGVLVGIAIPQFLGYVQRTKVNTDVKNGQEIASVLMAEIADESTAVSSLNTAGSGGAAVTVEVTQAMLNGKMTLPKVKANNGQKFFASYKKADSDLKILIGAAATGAVEVYPSATNYK